MKRQDYIVQVYVRADSAHDASKKVAAAMMGRGLSWQVLEVETRPAPNGMSPATRNIKTIAKFTGAFIGGKSLKL